MQKLPALIVFISLQTLPCFAQSVTLPIIEINPQKDAPDKAPIDMKQLHQGNAIDLMRAGKLEEAVHEAETALELAKKDGSKDIIASCYSVLGKVYRRQDRYEDSLKAYQQSLDYWRTKQPKPNFLVGMILINMGEEYKSMHQLDKAQATLLEAQSNLKEDDPNYCAVVENLGSVYFQQNKFAEAEAAWKKAVETSQKAFDKRSEADSSASLAFLYYKQGRLDQSKTLIEKAISLSEQQFGASSPHTTELKKLQEVIEKNPQQTSQTKTFDSDPDPQWRRLMDTGKVALDQNNYLQAITAYQSALAIVESRQPQSAAMAGNLSLLGTAYLLSGAFKKAEDALTRALPLYQKYFPSQPDLVAGIQSALAIAKAKQQP